jgi:hypothetical protein
MSWPTSTTAEEAVSAALGFTGARRVWRS